MPQTDGATAQAQEKAQEVAGQAQEKAQQAAGQAKDQVRTQVDQRSTQAGEQLSTQAGDIRSVGEQLREQGKDGPAKIADQAAERVERVGSYLQRSDADAILGDVEDFARQNPWAVVAGGIALGFAASRFLKAGQADRDRQPSSGQLTTGTGSAGRPAGVTPGAPGTATTGPGVTTGVGAGTPPAPTTPVTPATPAVPPTGGNELSAGVGADIRTPAPGGRIR
jgi:ElaB/YqjD/DUF883 family membrane-anchored ribosome-binding protein